MSVEFHHMNVRACPVCGCQTVVCENIEVSQCGSRTEVRTHTNGMHWEYRKFLCGFAVTWRPNYRAHEIDSACPATPGIAELRAEFKSLTEAEAQLRYKHNQLRGEEAKLLASIKL